ncbi:CVNH domain-containing protein [Ancylobacter oerskovii]|uniref:CVNH domain-containing protein n=1 Tax=Ancylobacter oerskovii TaxID=459519 RepID=A0ABW4YXH4_9HYPH|nr:CVNH domain-containing protein [Ancylobacter oerskovii]MBS7542122.1 CVNH domain-containing protein [Ancylobacter oerskovii]
MSRFGGAVAAACTLFCVAGAASAQSVPPGSYQQSCQDVRNVAGWLRASCRDRSGRWVEATLAISWCAPGNDISNEDGRLVCKPGSSGSSGFGERSPQGSYMGTCRDVRMSAGWLKASCQDMKGRWVDATTAASWCTGRDIANVDGRLTCR